MLLKEVSNVQNLIVKSPKKKNGFMYCKLLHHGDEKLEISLSKVELSTVKCVNDCFYLKCELDKRHRLRMLEIEDFVVTSIQSNVDDWFKNKISKELVEEYFQSCVVGDKLKARLDTDDVDSIRDLQGHTVDIVLRITGLKFLRQSVYMVFECVSCVESNVEPSFEWAQEESDDDDDADIDLYDECNGIRQQLITDYSYKLAGVTDQIETLSKIAQKLQGNLEKLENCLNPKIKFLDALYDDLNTENFLN